MTRNQPQVNRVLEKTEREKFTISWLEGNIFCIEIKERAYVDVDDVKEIQLYKAQFTQNQKHGVLFITPGFGNLSKEARVYSATEEASINSVAKAVVAPNLGMKIMANFFITFNKPVVIHKIFTNQQDAISWLSEMINLTK